jgi:hypothetical protein
MDVGESPKKWWNCILKLLTSELSCASRRNLQQISGYRFPVCKSKPVLEVDSLQGNRAEHCQLSCYI